MLENITVSDWIQIAGIIASLITGLAAIVISVRTLKQNNKMIEESTRPIVTMYSKHFGSRLYIVTKNVGASPCVIDSIESDMNIPNNGTQMFSGKRYDQIRHTSLPPQGTIICTLFTPGLEQEIFNFTVNYHSATHTYKDAFSINYKADNAFPSSNTNTGNTVGSLPVISRTFEDYFKLHL